jgi:hypothetical protein
MATCEVTITRNSGKRGMGHSRANLEGELKAITGTSDFPEGGRAIAQVCLSMSECRPQATSVIERFRDPSVYSRKVATRPLRRRSLDVAFPSTPSESSHDCVRTLSASLQDARSASTDDSTTPAWKLQGIARTIARTRSTTSSPRACSKTTAQCLERALDDPPRRLIRIEDIEGVLTGRVRQ